MKILKDIPLVIYFIFSIAYSEYQWASAESGRGDLLVTSKQAEDSWFIGFKAEKGRLSYLYSPTIQKSEPAMESQSAAGLNLSFNQIDPSLFPQITNYITIVDQTGTPISNLGVGNFIVKENNQNVAFSVTSKGGITQSVSVALALDNSGSIDNVTLNIINSDASTFISLLGANDEAVIYKYAEQVILAQDFTKNKNLLKACINSPRISGTGATRLNDAIYNAVFRVKLAQNRRGVILLTDGQQEGPTTYSVDQSIQLAVDNQIPVFTIGLGTNINASVLSNIASRTGGLFFQSATPADLQTIFTAIGGIISNQYEIKFTSPNPSKDGTLRTVSITAEYAGYSDTKSRTYNAPRAGEIVINLPDDISCSKGQSIILRVLVGNLTGANIYSYQFALFYDASVLKAKPAQGVGTLTSGWGSPVSNLQVSGQIMVGSYGTTPLSGAGVLVEIPFEVIGENGTYTSLRFNDFIFNNGSPPAKLQDGFAWITSMQISGSVTYYGNSQAVPNVTINLSNSTAIYLTDNAGAFSISNLARLANYTITPSKAKDTDIGVMSVLCHDAAYIAQATAGLRNLADNEKTAADVDRNGRIEMYDAALVARYAIALPKSADSHVGEWVFVPASMAFAPIEGNMIDQKISAILLGDVTDNWKLNKTNLMVIKNTVSAGQWISNNTFRVYFPDFIPSREISSLDIAIKYNKMDLKLSRIVWSKSIRRWQSMENCVAGNINIGAFTLNSGWDDDFILDLMFDPVSGNSYNSLTITKYFVEGNLICDAQTISSEPTSSFFSYALAQNFPNPFNTSTKISYTVGSDGLVQIYILNTLGQVVKTITKENHQAGSYEVYWHALDEFGNSVAPGIYLVVMRATGFIQTRKIILIK